MKKTKAETIRKRQEQKRKMQAIVDQHWHPYTHPMAAYAAGDFAAHYDLEQRQFSDEDTLRDEVDDQPNLLPF